MCHSLVPKGKDNSAIVHVYRIYRVKEEHSATTNYQPRMLHHSFLSMSG